ncbi:MAG: M64 family metallopeptidase [Polyangiaceae bacterium]
MDNGEDSGSGGVGASGGSNGVGGIASSSGGLVGVGGASSSSGGALAAAGGAQAGSTNVGGQSASGGNAGGGQFTSGGNASGGQSPSGGSASGGYASGGTASGGSASGGVASGGQSASGGTSASGGQSQGGSAGSVSSNVTDVIRVQVNYDAKSKQYQLGFAVREHSGTAALQKRALRTDSLGSFIGTLLEPGTQTVVYQQTIGTGYYYRELARAFTFRFPARTAPFTFRMTAENAVSGAQERVVDETIDPKTLSELPTASVETKMIKQASASPKLVMPIYAEGYLQARKDAFFADASSVANLLSTANFPGAANFEIVAVWSASNHTLGDVGKAGVVPTQDTALGLSFPVWSGISGPDLIIYPTDENKLRSALAQVPYDYPLVIVDDNRYWGVGNYNMYTAVPAHNSNVNGLLSHEMGHFFGLNEEYGGQETELAFAPGIAEPWSQNITFQTQRAQIKWGDLIESSVAIPTPTSTWTSGKKIGAYRGGYPNDSRSLIPVPDTVCRMSSGNDFCAVCRRAIQAKVAFDGQ